MKFIFFFLLVSNLAFASSQGDLNSLWKNPSEALLSAFKKSCDKKDQIDFDGGSVGDLLPLLQKSTHSMQIRALVFAEANCTDGASRERLLSVLGNEILLQHPGKLIQALCQEKRSDLATLPEQENSEWFAVECEDNACKKQRKAYFTEKRVALSQAKVKKECEPIRKGLLTHLPSDR